jgi:hypothetical protein
LVSLFLQIIDAEQILGLVRGSNAPSYTGLSGRPFYRQRASQLRAISRRPVALRHVLFRHGLLLIPLPYYAPLRSVSKQIMGGFCFSSYSGRADVATVARWCKSDPRF